MKPKVDIQPGEINLGIYEGKPLTSAIMPEKTYAEHKRNIAKYLK